MLNRNLHRGIVFLIDICISIVSLITAYALRFNFSIPESEIATFVWVFPLVIAIRAISFYIAKIYAGIIRFTSTQDVKRILITVASGAVFFGILNQIVYRFAEIYAIPYSIIIIDFLVTIFLMTTLRLGIKLIYQEISKTGKEPTNVLIYGAGEAGVITKRTLDRDAGTRYKVIAYLDDDRRKAGKKLEGIPIFYTPDQLENLLGKGDIRSVIISIQNLAPQRKQEIIETCLRHNTKVLTVPPVSNWINGQLSFGQILDIRIEDLLEREPIELDKEAISRQIKGKKILITGAAGSIGSEIVRQVMEFSPAHIYMLDIAESPLHELEIEIKETGTQVNSEAVIADVRNRDRMRNVFSTFRPDFIFHAAAYKHVPMMENNPSEAILTNVLGTKVTADLSNEYNADKFVLVSTDKAVNPTNIMGASKRIAEMYVQSLDSNSRTEFITTRFGNVLGSNGSVIPRFKKQIENRQPITVTHPDITRFFMTIPEACQLVLEAGAIGKGGVIYIFDMGKSVKIVDLAKKMIQLSGLELGKDISIEYTGLRPGEKLYEELLATEENTLPTHHKKILIAKVKEYDFEKVSRDIDDLVSMFGKQNNQEIVVKLKEMVPEYISKNSVYEILDTG